MKTKHYVLAHMEKTLGSLKTEVAGLGNIKTKLMSPLRQDENTAYVSPYIKTNLTSAWRPDENKA